MCCRKTLAQFNQPHAKLQCLINNSFPTHTVLSNQTPQALEFVVTQCPKQLCTCLSNVFASWTCSAASLRTACASPCSKSWTQVSFLYRPLNSKFQVTSLYRLHLTLSVIKGFYNMDHYTLPRQFGSNSDFNTCMCGFDTSWILSYMLQGSSGQFYFFLYYSPLTSWKQEDKHRTSPANYYSIWNRPSWLSEASPNLKGWCHLCHNHSD